MQPVVMLVGSGIFMFAVIGGFPCCRIIIPRVESKAELSGTGSMGRRALQVRGRLRKLIRKYYMNRKSGGRVNICRQRRDLCLAVWNGQEDSMPLWTQEMSTV